MNISTNSKIVKISRAAAKKQLAALFPGEDTFTFQWFDDSPAKDKRKAKTICGTFDKCANQLITANRAGCGIYVTINHTIGERRRREDVDRVRYHFIEADEGAEPLEKIKDDLQPVLVIESSPGKYHAYAAIDDDLARDLAGFPARQKKLAAYFKAGKESVDLARVLRLAGFLHQKNPLKPFQVRIIEDEPCAPTWSREDLDMLLAGVDVPETAKAERSETPAADEDAGAIDWATRWFANDAPIAISDTENPDSGKKGNSTTYVAMCEARDRGVNEQTCLDLAYELYNPRCDPEWDFDKLKEIVHDAYLYSQNTQGEKSVSADFGNDSVELSAKDKKDIKRAANERKQRIIDGGLDYIIANTVKGQNIDWIWLHHLALGQHTAIAGVQGDGKSQLAYSFIASVTTGGKWPMSDETAPIGRCVILSAEDTLEDVLVPRLAAAGADLSKVIIIKAVRDQSGKSKHKFNLQADIGKLKTLVKSLGDVKLIMLDPISSYLGGDIDSHSNTELRDALDPITDMAHATGAAVVSITHFKKDTKNISALAAVMGGAGFTAAPRAAFAVIRDAKDKNNRMFLSLKCNLMAEGTAYGIIYKIEEVDTGLVDERDKKPILAPHVVFIDKTDMTADEALAAVQAGGKPESLLKSTMKWLRELLNDGPMLRSEIEDKADGEDISPATLRRAKKFMKVVHYKQECPDDPTHGPWLWTLPGVTDAKTDFAETGGISEAPEHVKTQSGINIGKRSVEEMMAELE